ncbi:MAG: hypothetical protein E7I42_11090 [Pluralibacter gergoviae]|nr:hypothetical protein [Pluralibacter gergoviae]
MKKKLKRKHKTYAKSVQVSRNSRTAEKSKISCKVLKIFQFISCAFSMYRSMRDLGWLEHLPALVERIGVVLKLLSLVFKRFF